MEKLRDLFYLIAIPTTVIAPMVCIGSNPDYLFQTNNQENSSEQQVLDQVIEEEEQGPCPKHYLNYNTPLSDLISEYQTANPDAELKKSIHVKKQCRLLTIRLDDVDIKQYDAALGSKPDFDKVMEGDRATPTGTFYIADKDLQSRGETSWYKALHISYPNEEDARRGLKQKLITKSQANAINRAVDNCQMPPQNTKLGSLLKVHGKGGYKSSGDWTWGCVGLDNWAIDEIYTFAEEGCNSDGSYKTPIIIEY